MKLFEEVVKLSNDNQRVHDHFLTNFRYIMGKYNEILSRFASSVQHPDNVSLFPKGPNHDTIKRHKGYFKWKMLKR